MMDETLDDIFGRDEEIRFFYDSRLPKFFGTRVCCTHNLDYFRVVSVTSYCNIFEVGRTTARPIRQSMQSRIVGEFSSLSVEDSFWLDVDPFDVRIYSYDPISDKAYVAKVLNIFPYSGDYREHKVGFQAQTLLKWREISEEK